MKRILLCSLASIAAILFPACESEREVTTTTTTEETVTHPAGAATQTTHTTTY